jgi:hypothetical protein
LLLHPEYQPAGDLTAPLSDSPLERSKLPRWKPLRRARLQTQKQIFSIGVRLFIQPLLDEGPDLLEGVFPCAPSARTGRSLAVCRAHFPIPPRRRKTRHETVQWLGGWSDWARDANFQLRQHSLGFPDLLQQLHRIQ